MRCFYAIVTMVCATMVFAQVSRVKLGVEVLREHGFKELQGKRIGLITNPTGVDSKLKSTVDILFEAKGVKLVALFGPEHGVRGNYSAGDVISTTTDSATNLPVYSLYGTSRKPTAEMLEGIDALVYDIQDIGCRSYTYVSTMGLAMEAAAENNIEFVVLDRPNPLGGIRTEGNVVKKGFESFVSQYPVPYVYGLTCGELARMLNGEGMLKYGKKCTLSVLPMRGWRRSMTWEETGLHWVPPSPHIPEPTSPMAYVSTGMLGELGVISEGVGYTIPFKTLAAEWIDSRLLADKMNALKLEGVLFRPTTFKPYYARYKDKNLHGVEVHIASGSKLNLMSLQFLFMQVHNELYPDKNPFTLADSSRLRMFDKVAGSDEVRKLFSLQMRYDDVRAFLDKDVAPFRAKAGKYLLY